MAMLRRMHRMAKRHRRDISRTKGFRATTSGRISAAPHASACISSDAPVSTPAQHNSRSQPRTRYFALTIYVALPRGRVGFGREFATCFRGDNNILETETVCCRYFREERYQFANCRRAIRASEKFTKY